MDPVEIFVMNQDVSGIPTEIQLVPVGRWKGYLDSSKNKFKEFDVTEPDVAEMEKNFVAGGIDLPIDYEHQTLTGDIAPASGWIKKVINKGKDGLWGVVEWTAKAIEFLRNKEYRYLSPVFTLTGTDKKTGKKIGATLLNAALTNTPFFSELKPIISKSTAPDDQGTTIFLTTQKETVMKNLIAKLISTFKMAESATEEEIIAKFDSHVNASALVIAAKNKVLETLGLKPDAAIDEVKSIIAAKQQVFELLGLKPEATVEEAKGVIVAAKSNGGTLQTLTTELNTLRKQMIDEKFDLVIAKGIETGRILPSQRSDTEWIGTQRGWAEKNLTSFSEYFTAKAPVIGPLTPIPTGDLKKSGANITEMDLIVAKNLGVKKEDLEKYNKQVN